MVNSDRQQSSRWRAFGAEFIGTFFFVFAVIALVVVAAFQGEGSLFVVAIAHGLALAVTVAAAAPLSGGHLNPAVTLGALVAGEIEPLDALGYVVAQLVGAIVAAVFASALLPSEAVASTQLAAVDVGANAEIGKVFVLEALLTAMWVWCWFAAVRGRETSGSGALVVGGVLAVATLIAAPLTGAAFNPARAFGPGTIAGGVDGQWVYWIAPLLGGVIAAAAHRLLAHTDADEANG